MAARSPLLIAALALAAPAFAQEPALHARWDAFPVFVWRLEYGRRAAPEPLLAPFGGTNVEGSEDAEWVLARELDFYVGHAPGRNELHLEREYPWYDAAWKRYYEERDPSALVREPCLSEPGTLEELEARLARSLAARGGANGLGVSLGDEVGLTPYGDPFDLCASAACRAAWKRYLEREELDAELPYVGTDAVRRALLADDDSLVGAWLARRRFHQEVVLGALERLANESRALSPGTPVGLVGLGGRTAFGGVAVERALSFLDFLEPYRTGDARELLYTQRAPERRALATIFPDDTEHGPAWQAFDHWLRGADGLVLWCDRDLEQDEAYFARLARAVATIRALKAELPAFRARPSGVALVHSADSIALSWLEESLHDGPTWPRRFAGYHEEHGARERALRAWLRLIEDAGLMPGSVPVERVGADTAARFPLLVASHVSVVGAPELAAFAAHVEAGGRLFVQGPFGTRDAAGRRPADDPFERLRALAPGRVERPPPGFDLRLMDSIGDRTAAGGANEPLRASLRARAAKAGAALPPFQLTLEPDLGPLLVASSAGERPGELLVAALPNALDPAQRAALVPAALQLELEEGWRVEWIHPPASEDGARTLPAGDPAVFRIVDR